MKQFTSFIGACLLFFALFVVNTPAIKAQTGKEKTQAQTDDELIKQYLKANKLTKKFKKTASGIYYRIDKKGKGPKPEANSQLKVHYKGTLLNGAVFDSSYDRGQPIDFSPNMVIKGWQEGLLLFAEGSKGTLIIPSGLAYGSRAMGEKLGPNSVLRFDMDLLEVKPASAQSNMPDSKPAQDFTQADDNAILNYLKKEGLSGNAKKTASGVYYIVETEGSGKQPDINALVTVHYKGSLLNGTVFDSSYDRGEPISFPLSGVIKGWQDGIPMLKEGGKGILLIPSGLAYGSRSMGSIPANSVLRFDVELLEVKSGE